MISFKKILLVIMLLITGKLFSQPADYFSSRLKGGDQKEIYTRTAKLSEAAAEKYDAIGCTESAAYCRKIVAWCNCMLSNLAGNSCGLEPLLENAPKCDAATIGGSGSGISSGSSADPYKQMQLKQQQTQQELNNAQNVSMNAYQEPINSGKKESGAMLDATLAGAQQISDPTTSLVYTGIGLGISLFAHLSEKKAEKKEKASAAEKEEEQKRAESDRKELIIETKNKFVQEALDINKYTFSDLISKDRYASILLVPSEYSSSEQAIYFSSPLQINKYSDDTYPLKPEIEKKLLAVIDKKIVNDYKAYILYPITDLEKFTNDFVKKMGSGKVIYLNAQLIEFLKNPFAEENLLQNSDADFWGNPVKKDETKSEKKKVATEKKPNDDYWNK
jgi:hypothetical protein